MAKVLITEKINPIGIEVIKNAGHEVIQMETLEESELKEKSRTLTLHLSEFCRSRERFWKVQRI